MQGWGIPAAAKVRVKLGLQMACHFPGLPVLKDGAGSWVRKKSVPPGQPHPFGGERRAMITPIIHKRTRQTLGYVKDFTPNYKFKHRIAWRAQTNKHLCFELDGRVKERLNFIREFGYRPYPSPTFMQDYRVKVSYRSMKPLAIIVHGEREAESLMFALGKYRANKDWRELRA